MPGQPSRQHLHGVFHPLTQIRFGVRVSSGADAVDRQLHESGDPWFWTSCLSEEATSH